MKNKQLPPELVEKMRLEIRNVGDWQVPLYSKQCAKIAVDYFKEEMSKCKSYTELKQHRDELIELLKKVSDQFNAMPEGYDPGNCNGEILYTLKKHEDGKE